MTTYSKKISHKIKIEDQDTGDVRIYKFHPMSARYVFAEGTTLGAKIAKIGTAYTLGLEAGEDLYGKSAIAGMVLHAIEEGLPVEYKLELAEKVLGDLSVDGDKIHDLDVYFDDEEKFKDYLEVFMTATWLTFKDFFTKSSILQRKMKPLTEMLQNLDLDKLMKKLETNVPQLNEESDQSQEPLSDTKTE